LFILEVAKRKHGLRGDEKVSKKTRKNMELKACRARKGLSEKKMAETMGISYCSYNRKENGHGDFTLSEAKIISDILDTDPATLFFAP